MKTTINVYDFRDAFRAMDRKENFTYEGLGILFEYLEQYEEDTGEEMELDVIAICCDFSEDTVDDIANNYTIDLSECEDDDEKREVVMEYLSENTMVVGETGSTIIYQAF